MREIYEWPGSSARRALPAIIVRVLQRTSPALLLIAALLGGQDATTVSPRRSVPNDSTPRVVLLGTGTPIPDPERRGPALAVIVNGASYLVDAGPGVVRRAVAAAIRDSMPALRAPNLRYVFLTHLHSDHTLGLADVMLTPA